MSIILYIGWLVTTDRPRMFTHETTQNLVGIELKAALKPFEPRLVRRFIVLQHAFDHPLIDNERFGRADGDGDFAGKWPCIDATTISQRFIGRS